MYVWKTGYSRCHSFCSTQLTSAIELREQYFHINDLNEKFHIFLFLKKQTLLTMMWTACKQCIRVDIWFHMYAGFASSISAFGLEEPIFYDMYLCIQVYNNKRLSNSNQILLLPSCHWYIIELKDWHHRRPYTPTSEHLQLKHCMSFQFIRFCRIRKHKKLKSLLAIYPHDGLWWEFMHRQSEQANEYKKEVCISPRRIAF